jgi:hypothetical protein
MPVYTRKQLRQALGQRYLTDTEIGNVTASLGNGVVIDSARSDTSLSGESLYSRAWVRINGMTLRTSSFNTASGAFITGQIAASTVPSGAEYEVHKSVSPDDKDREITATVLSLRFRQEVQLSAVTDCHVYTLPASVLDVLDVRSYSDAASSLDRGEAWVGWFALADASSTIRELRIQPSLSASQTLVIDAIVSGTLGPADTDTITLPDAEWPLAGAAARCYWLAETHSPGQETGLYAERRKELARTFALKNQKYQPFISRRVMFDERF